MRGGRVRHVQFGASHVHTAMEIDEHGEKLLARVPFFVPSLFHSDLLTRCFNRLARLRRETGEEQV